MAKNQLGDPGVAFGIIDMAPMEPRTVTRF